MSLCISINIKNDGVRKNSIHFMLFFFFFIDCYNEKIAGYFSSHPFSHSP